MRFSACRFVAQALWVFVAVAAIIVKLVEDDIDNYPVHLTYWAFTAETLFLALTLVAVAPRCVDCAATVVVVCYFPLLGLAWFIAIAVNVLFLDDPQFALDLFALISPGLVIVGNDFVHVVPVFVMSLYGLLNAPLVQYALNRCFARGAFDRQPQMLGLAVVYLVAGGGTLFVVGYLATLALARLSPQDVYDTDISSWAGVGVFVATSVVVNGVVLGVCANSFGVCRRWDDTKQRRRRINVTEFEDEDLRASPKRL